MHERDEDIDRDTETRRETEGRSWTRHSYSDPPHSAERVVSVNRSELTRRR